MATVRISMEWSKSVLLPAAELQKALTPRSFGGWSSALGRNWRRCPRATCTQGWASLGLAAKTLVTAIHRAHPGTSRHQIPTLTPSHRGDTGAHASDCMILRRTTPTHCTTVLQDVTRCYKMVQGSRPQESQEFQTQIYVPLIARCSNDRNNEHTISTHPTSSNIIQLQPSLHLSQCNCSSFPSVRAHNPSADNSHCRITWGLGGSLQLAAIPHGQGRR